jgi:DNA-binding transcriptional MerR regulator
MGEACDELGVSARTLRYYEEVGLVLPGRTPGGHRVYGANEIETVGRIQRMQAMGLSLSTIRNSLRYRAYRDETGRRKFDVPTLVALAGEARTDAQALRTRIADLERELTAARGEAEGLERDAAFLEGLLTERRAEEEARRGRRP